MKRLMIIKKCPICSAERCVRKEGAGLLCRRCRSRENSKNNIGRYKDLTGKRFGKLLVESSLRIEGKKGSYWICICDCGNKKICANGHLHSGQTKSCGCIMQTQKGLSNTPSYRSWRSMNQRCYDKTVPHYARYGARGINVCDRWRYSFLSFLDDMGDRPTGKTLDRIDTGGSYCKENCRWATNNQQGNNRKNNHLITAFGKTQTLTEWGREKNLKWCTLLGRILLGWSIEDTLTKELGHRMPKKKKK